MSVNHLIQFNLLEWNFADSILNRNSFAVPRTILDSRHRAYDIGTTVIVPEHSREGLFDFLFYVNHILCPIRTTWTLDMERGAGNQPKRIVLTIKKVGQKCVYEITEQKSERRGNACDSLEPNELSYFHVQYNITYLFQLLRLKFILLQHSMLYFTRNTYHIIIFGAKLGLPHSSIVPMWVCGYLSIG